MASVTMLKCTESHWQGHEFVPAGTLVPEGDARVIPAFFEPIVIEAADPKPAKAPRATKATKATKAP